MVLTKTVQRLQSLLRKTREDGLKSALRAAVRGVVHRVRGQAQIQHLARLVQELQRTSSGKEAGSIERRLAGLERQAAAWQREVADSVRTLALHQATLEARRGHSLAQDGPLVSVVMPVWNRRTTVLRAIDSVLGQTYVNWELIVVDDGSTDQTDTQIERHCTDPRIHLLRQAHRGVSAARNLALRHARGSIVAYLDSDNYWFCSHLAEVVDALQQHPEQDCVYFAQLVDDTRGRRCFVRHEPFERAAFEQRNHIDLNAFAHRRSLVDTLGGFDEQLSRFVDWDLIARYTRAKEPVTRPIVTGWYDGSQSGRISTQTDRALNYYRVRRNNDSAIDRPLRVLYALWHYPQLTESYMRWEIVRMQRWGAQVEVWSELNDAPAPFVPEARVHHGALADAIDRFQPHVVHVHWLNCVLNYREPIVRAGLPITTRCHAFDFSPALVAKLQRDPAVSGIYLFPHFADQLDRLDKVQAMRAAFLGDLFYPGPKDPKLVVRACPAMPKKDLHIFMEAARRCPEFRFVLVLGRVVGSETYPEEVLARNKELGSPVEIHINLPAEETARLVRSAAIYLHTSDPEHQFGMPVGIAEAMATGAYVLGPSCEGLRGFLGPTGAIYESLDEAVELIRATLRWSHGKWQATQRLTAEFAYEQYADMRVLRPLFDQWLDLAEKRAIFNLGPPPNDERWSRFIDFAMKKGYDRRRHHDGTLLAHSLGIGRGLAAWKCDVDICLAGLAHSLYGTDRAGVSVDASLREELRELIGPRAEQLAFLNCAMDPSSLDEALLRGTAPFRLRDRTTGTDLELSAEVFDDLCRVHLCDWLEQVPRCGAWHEQRDRYARLAQRLGGLALASFENVYRQSFSSAPSRSLLPGCSRHYERPRLAG